MNHHVWLCGTGDRIQSFVHMKQALYRQSSIPSPKLVVLMKNYRKVKQTIHQWLKMFYYCRGQPDGFLAPTCRYTSRVTGAHKLTQAYRRKKKS